jgi:hypothetical protein
VDLDQGGEAVNTLLFIFHNTLMERHLDLSINSLLALQTRHLKWDRVLIHNTHNTISTGEIVERFQKYPSRIGEVQIIQPQGQQGSLHQDLRTCFTHIKSTVSSGRILVLKGDYSVSSNFNEVYLSVDGCMDEMSQWSLPIYNAKEGVDDWEIFEKLETPYFALTDDYTYYRCGTNPEHTPVDEVLSTRGQRDDSPLVKFVGHNVLPDYNLHVFGWKAAHVVTECYDALPVFAGWNCVGDMFKMLMTKGVNFYKATRAFGVHTFHAVDRGDPRKMIPGQRY